jgi:hypothetical protein
MLKNLILLLFVAISISASVRWLFDPTRGAQEIRYDEFITTLRSERAQELYKDMSHSSLERDFWDREIMTLRVKSKPEPIFVVLPANKLDEAERESRRHHAIWKGGLTALPLVEVAIVGILMTPWILFATGFLGHWPSLATRPPYQARKSP